MDYTIIFIYFCSVNYFNTSMAKIKSGFMGERAIILPSPIIEEFKQSELGSTLYITDIGFYPKAHFHFRKRTKEEAIQHILMYCVEGEGWYEIDNQIQKVSENHVFVLPKSKAHSYGSLKKNPWTIYWIHFDGEKAAFFSDGLQKPLLVSPEKDSRIEDRLKLFEEIYYTLQNGYSINNLEFSIILLYHFLGSLKYMNTFRSSLTERQSKREMTEDAIHFMRENLQKPLKLNEIAHYTGLSTSHFSLLFKQKTGFSPLNYFNQLRIQSACHQLDFSTLSITQIAKMTGFDDPLYFSRLFSKIMGCSPTKYRKSKKG